MPLISDKKETISALESLSESYIEQVGIPLRPVYDKDAPLELNDAGYLIPSHLEVAGSKADIHYDDILRDFRGSIVLLDQVLKGNRELDEVFDSWGSIPPSSTVLEILTKHHPMPSMNELSMACVRLSDNRNDFGDIIHLPDKIREIPGAVSLINKLHQLGKDIGSQELY